MCQTSGIDVSANVLDITLAQELFQWKPQITIEEDLKKTFQYLKNEKITDYHRNR